ncbi:Pectate lyase superfamily protein [Bacillus sp. cl95]|nr:Pectate lyase superfamily protein [Bacillus sp. UNCCL13]SFQ87301.1 Pectate lyase superfamily protein [Bacillus sp. cl95]
MLYLDNKHHPKKNAKLISRLAEKRLEMRHALQETDRLFEDCALNSDLSILQKNRLLPFGHPLVGITRLFLTRKISEPIASYDTCVNETGLVYPGWKEQLDNEYTHLLDQIEREVNVADFGAVGDGITDNTEAFKRAIGNGRVKICIPAGVFITKGIKLPSWTCFTGAGKGKTVLKLHNNAPKRAWLLTNSHHWRGNRNIFIQGMSLDWNIERLGIVEKTSSGNNFSSCLTFAHVMYGWVKDVEAINPGLHCFDVSSSYYDYSGDGFRARGPSRFIWLDNLNGSGFGDDGITTHHSDNIFISNCHMCDPSGRSHRKGFSNSNGIEIDDGSRNVWLLNNSSSRCFGGIEIKAHYNSSAACNVQIIGHLSINDNRSYNFRHIGHHSHTDPESKTAYNIKATNLIAIAPIFTDLYKESTPRALVVSGYRNVAINNFTIIGDPNYDFQQNPIVAIQYRAKNVVLNNVSIRDFKNANTDAVKVFGGPNRAENVKIQNLKVHEI